MVSSNPLELFQKNSSKVCYRKTNKRLITIGTNSINLRYVTTTTPPTVPAMSLLHPRRESTIPGYYYTRITCTSKLEIQFSLDTVCDTTMPDDCEDPFQNIVSIYLYAVLFLVIFTEYIYDHPG